MSLESAIAGEFEALDVATWEAAYRRRKHALCAISVPVPGGIKLGTGILIGPDLVLTNYHVINECHRGSRAVARGLRCRFDYFDAGSWQDRNAPQVALATSEWLVAYGPTSPLDSQGADSGRNKNDLDYAIIRLDSEIGNQPLSDADASDRRAWEPLRAKTRLPEENESITLMHHPAATGRPRPLSLRLSESKILGLVDDNQRVRHGAWSAPGSSGGPCFGRNSLLVALHQGGDVPRDGQPARWNQSIPIAEIVRHLKANGAEGIIGREPPEPDDDARLEPRRDVDRLTITKKMVARRSNAAKILLDRNPVETDIVLVKQQQGMVHVITCREADRHVWLLDRLCQLSLRLSTVGLETMAARRDLLLATAEEVPGAWAKRGIPPAPRDLGPAARIERLMAQIGRPQGGQQILVEIVTSIDDCSFGSERELVTGLAARCAQEQSPSNLQVVFVYYGGPSPPEKDGWRDKRSQFAAMWTTDPPPPGCGVCLALPDIGYTDLTPWSTDLNAAWKVDETKLRGRITAHLPEGVKKTMGEVEACLDPVIQQVLEDTL